MSLAQQTPPAQAHPVDSLVDKHLFGDRVTTIIQFVFQQPPWVMWGGVGLAAILAFFIFRWLWPRRGAMLTWLRTRRRQVKVALLAGVGFAGLLALVVGYQGYHFVETDKRFCNGCHIFVPSGQVWALPDSGNYTLVPRMEGKHDSLSCHACHPLKPMKEAVKLVFWMSGVREEKIPEHAKVPRATCEDCHVQGEAKEAWQAIAATSGHRTHLESDSSALKDKVECLTCHARTAHRFQPVNQTCGQSGCHEESKTRIMLGRMAQQGDFHCVACHDFVATVPLLATRDSAAGVLRPAIQQCFKCHEMKQRLPDFDAARDPHAGTCGMCHDPHVQKTPAEARTTCASAACHSDWRQEPFHVGAQHKRVAQNCLTCHQPHAARVDASDCTNCHNAVRLKSGGRLAPPMPFDTLKALRQSRAPPDERPERPDKVKGDTPPTEGQAGANPPPWDLHSVPALPSDTFSHDRHKKLTCLTCHVPAAPRSRITFEAPRGCQICHHQGPMGSACTTCHESEELSPPHAATVTVAAAGKPARARSVAFSHRTHKGGNCVQCHTQSVTLAPVDSVTSCVGCHRDHHAAGRDCAACHRTESIAAPHARPTIAHVRCDACHTTSKVAGLEPTRSFCLGCHAPEEDHYSPTECTICHFLQKPAEYQGRLIRARGGG